MVDLRGMSARMCLQMQNFVALLLRIKKALGIFRELITTRRATRVAFWDPPSASKKTFGIDVLRVSEVISN